MAYADFVTAMMAFFLVMWICGQDQSIRRAVSYYFNDPFNTSMIGSSKQPTCAGSVSDLNRFGNVPLADSAALGQGRKSYTPPDEKATATQHVSTWLRSDPKNMKYWEDQAQQARMLAAAIKEVQQKLVSPERAALLLLAKRLKYEVSLELAADAKGIHQDLIAEALDQVNWIEIAEDLLAR